MEIRFNHDMWAMLSTACHPILVFILNTIQYIDHSYNNKNMVSLNYFSFGLNALK